jgi:hypothetical protein
MGLLETYKPKSLDVIVLRGQWWNPLTPVVATRTMSRWTHCVQVRGSDGIIYDAHFPGVKAEKLSNYQGRYAAVLRRRDIDSIPSPVKIKMISWADKLVSDDNKYDFLALLGFYFGIRSFVKEDNKWYCAEIPYYMWEYHGYPLFNEKLTYIFPSDHYRNRCYQIISEGEL